MAEITGKTTTKKAVTKATAASAKPVEKKIAVAKKPVAAKAMDVSAEQRYRMVAEAAYFRAESNQFMSDPVRDWIEAENDIAALLSGKK